MKSVTVKPGCCAVCSKPVGKTGWVTWQHPNVMIHHGCLPRIVSTSSRRAA